AQLRASVKQNVQARSQIPRSDLDDDVVPLLPRSELAFRAHHVQRGSTLRAVHNARMGDERLQHLGMGDLDCLTEGRHCFLIFNGQLVEDGSKLRKLYPPERRPTMPLLKALERGLVDAAGVWIDVPLKSVLTSSVADLSVHPRKRKQRIFPRLSRD